MEALSAQRGLLKRFVNQFKKAAIRDEVRALFERDASFPNMLDVRIAWVRSLASSAELAGAQAELEVIERLRRLPDYFTVFNDVRLEADRHIFFDGAALQSAQVDHVVVGPDGVFVIETKRWSSKFVASGAFHDPYDQSARAGYLCYDLLKHLGKVRVRSIIACRGSLPPAPADSHTAVVRPDDLTEFIKRFSSPRVNLELIERIRAFFRERVASRVEA